MANEENQHPQQLDAPEESVAGVAAKSNEVTVSSSKRPTSASSSAEDETCTSAKRSKSSPVSNEASNDTTAEHTDDAEAKPSATASHDVVLDAATVLSMRAGDRIEVEWDVAPSEDAEPQTHWWPATLLAYEDGRTIDSCAIRTLEYDPYPEGGFPESSKEDVVFLGRSTLADPVSGEEYNYRPEGGSVEVPHVEDAIDMVLSNVLEKNSGLWKAMDPAQQAILADKIATKKSQLVEKLEDFLKEHPHRTISSEDMLSMLQQVMSE